MSMEKKVQLASELHLLGVSKDGVIELLWKYPLEQIEAQLKYLPYRKAKRPEAMIFESIRKNYSPPKEFYYAQAKADLATAFDAVDEGSKQTTGRITSNSEGHRTPSDFDNAESDIRLAEGTPAGDDDLPLFDPQIR